MSNVNPAYAFRPIQVLRRRKRPLTGETIVRLPWGSELTVDAADLVGSGIARMGVHELETTETVWRLADRTRVALDIGANFGYFASLLSCRAPHVRAFEPHPQIHALLERNARAWRNVTVDSRAVSDRAGTAVLSTPDDFDRNQGTAALASVGAGITVETVRLDDVVNEPVGLAKLDIEGHELAALRGAERLLRDRLVRDWVFEAHDDTRADVFDHLREHGYALFGLARTFWGVQLVEPSDPRAIPRWDAPNFLATLDPNRAIQRMQHRGWRSLLPHISR